MQPIREKETIGKIKFWLLKNKDYKYYFLFTLGLNCGLRISDLTKLTTSDVKDKDVLVQKMKKTGKEVRIPLNPYIKAEISKYVNGKRNTDYLFSSRVGVNRPITRQAASYLMKEIAAEFNLQDFNSHSLRKSFGYWYYKQNHDIYFLMKLFGHQTQQQTLDYIGVLEEEIIESMKEFAV